MAKRWQSWLSEMLPVDRGGYSLLNDATLLNSQSIYPSSRILSLLECSRMLTFIFVLTFCMFILSMVIFWVLIFLFRESKLWVNCSPSVFLVSEISFVMLLFSRNSGNCRLMRGQKLRYNYISNYQKLMYVSYVTLPIARHAWQSLGNMNPDAAMEKYISLLTKSIPGWMGEKSGVSEWRKNFSSNWFLWWAANSGCWHDC